MTQPAAAEVVQKLTAIGEIPIPLEDGKSEFVFQFPDPGDVVGVAFKLEKRLVMTRGQAGFNEQLTLFVRFVPNGPQRKHRFLVAASGTPYGCPDGFYLMHVGTAVSQNTGKVCHVFEVVEELP